MLSQRVSRYILIVLLFIFSSSEAQINSLPKNWKFKIGDNMEWASPSFNDAGWANKQPGTSWSAKGMKDNVYAWYRIKIIIPSGIKRAEKGNGIKLMLGKIDDVDQTFFNGKMIGQTGSLPPGYETKWNDNRIYTIPENNILWDKENVIAVRVFSLDAANIGMYQGPYNYGPVRFSDLISIQHTITETTDHGFITKIDFTNKGDYAFDGTVKYWIDDKNDKEVYSESKPVHVKPGQGSETEITFSDYKPVNEKIFKVGYEV